MHYSICPICKKHRRHKLHTKECAEKARELKNESFIGAYKSSIKPQDLPEFTKHRGGKNRFY